MMIQNNSLTPQKMPFRTITVTDSIIPNNPDILMPTSNFIKSRKTKSLGHLCKNFIKNYLKEENSIIIIDECAKLLNVERRRIYDIINILECFGCLNRKGKNCYNWLGTKAISNSLKSFGNSSSSRTQFQSSINQNLTIHQDMKEIKENNCSITGMPFLKKSFRKERSLGLICLQFISLFSLSTKCILSLDLIAEKLSKNEKDENSKKTKIRRLYDIANVLQAIGILKKVSVLDKKTSYEWMGYLGFEGFLQQTFLKQDLSHEEEATPIQIEITPTNLSKNISPFELSDEINQNIKLSKTKILCPFKINQIDVNQISPFDISNISADFHKQNSQEVNESKILKENIIKTINEEQIMMNMKRINPFHFDEMKPRKIKPIWKDNLQLLLEIIDKNNQKP